MYESSAHKLAMLGLQSSRYQRDEEYREAVDAVLAEPFLGVGKERRTEIVNPGQMTLNELIQFLEWRDPNKILPVGFSDPHSYRGYYCDLAFEPRENTTIGEMLASARFALGRTFEGYKGGDYTMTGYTDVWLANWGESGETIGPILLGYMVGER